MIILKTGLVLGIIGHAVNFWCDRALSVTPKGKITLATMKEINNLEGMAWILLFVSGAVFAILGSGHHVKYALGVCT